MSLPIHTFTGMTRGYKGDFIRNLSLEEDGKEVHLEILSKAHMLRKRVTEIPGILKWPDKKKEKTKRKSKFKVGKIIQSHLLFSFSESPIMLFGTLGGLVLLMGLLIGGYLSFLHFLLNQVIGDRIILIITMVFLVLSGMGLFLFCFIAYQIKDLKRDVFKIYNQIENQSLAKRDRNPDNHVGNHHCVSFLLLRHSKNGDGFFFLFYFSVRLASDSSDSFPGGSCLAMETVI